MTFERAVFFFSDGTTANTGKQYGPFEIPAIGRLLRLEVRGTLVYEPGTWASSSSFVEPAVFGAQSGVHGYTPLDPVSQAGNPDWYDHHALLPTSAIASFSPSTDTAEKYTVHPIELNWQGYQPLNVDTDFYFSSGSFFSSTSTVDWVMQGSLALWYTP